MIALHHTGVAQYRRLLPKCAIVLRELLTVLPSPAYTIYLSTAFAISLAPSTKSFNQTHVHHVQPTAPTHPSRHLKLNNLQLYRRLGQHGHSIPSRSGRRLLPSKKRVCGSPSLQLEIFPSSSLTFEDTLGWEPATRSWEMARCLSKTNALYGVMWTTTTQVALTSVFLGKTAWAIMFPSL